MPHKSTNKQSAATPAPEWITRQQAAELLGVDVRTVDRHIKAERIKTKRPKLVIGRGGIRILVRRADVEILAKYDPTTDE